MGDVNRCVRIVRLSEIEDSADDLRPRSKLNDPTVAQFAARLKAGDVFPPVLVFQFADRYWLADGYHRVAAVRLGGGQTIVAEVRAGTRDDAAWAACAANRRHGLPRTTADKRHVVLRALAHARGQKLSDRQIARHCGVHHHTVGRLRAQLEQSGAIRQIRERVVCRGGSVYVQCIEGVRRSNVNRAADMVRREAPVLHPLTRPTALPIRDASPRATNLIPSAAAKLEGVARLLAEVDASLALLDLEAAASTALSGLLGVQQIIRAREVIRQLSSTLRNVLDRSNVGVPSASTAVVRPAVRHFSDHRVGPIEARNAAASTRKL
jgi:hypothetical protein